ncbi:TIGR03943 family putative permease subunit [Salisediminibacterium selenitireducens]|uniref:TIGR03943 family protein n=1 Tax=Bacillus selenitireducens (strain ATCC 700615 / DSM 15326 / MLS10) TaxID=439292 RepID=D6Y096_BACIE|nr:TIGR03943 family protein [Salisediminibacterium selenitireducens]ADH98487.1 Protein of unknown function DUF1980 [[Bacillus] selenitireducens MLS10]
MKQNRYDHSYHAFIQGIILLGFALLMLNLILTGNIVYYIAPTMMPFIYFALAVFSLLGVVQVLRGTKSAAGDHEHSDSCGCDHDHEIKGPPVVKVLIYSIFVLPILFGFTLPDQALDSSVAANRGIQFAGSSQTTPDPDPGTGREAGAAETEEASSGDLSRAEAYLEDPDGYLENIDSQVNPAGPDVDHFQIEDLYGEDWFDDYQLELRDRWIGEEIILVDDDNYIDIMTMLDYFMDDFTGTTLEITGFSYREAGLNDDQLISARFAMTCCTADVTVHGLLFENPDAYRFSQDQWLTVRGTLDVTEHSGIKMPYLTDTEITEIPEPARPYVYPSY